MSMKNRENSLIRRKGRELSIRSAKVLASALALGIFAASAAHAGGLNGGVVGSRDGQKAESRQSSEHGRDVETSGRKPGVGMGSDA